VSSAKAPSYSTTIFVRDHCLCLHVQRAARILARRFDEAFRPLGLTHGQFSLLMSLNRPEPPAMGQVAKLLAVDRTTLTAALKLLERRGLVRVQNDRDDRRSRTLSLTAKGRGLLARAAPIWQLTEVQIERRLSGARLDALRAGLMALS
jgi:DNA-binding MarR family transcriptional regulator